MDDQVAQVSDTDDLLAEIRRLKGEVARLEERVEHLDELAHQDPLCSLPNRRGFMRRLDQLIDRARRHEYCSAMLFVDVDGLKLINDSFGHKAGDEALLQVAALLMRGVRQSDFVARIGGDEFGILLEKATESSAEETAARLADQIADCDFLHDGDALPLSVAIGVSMIGADDHADAVMDRADTEMYKRKAAA